MKYIVHAFIILNFLVLDLSAASSVEIPKLFENVKKSNVPDNVTLPAQALRGKFVRIDKEALKSNECNRNPYTKTINLI